MGNSNSVAAVDTEANNLIPHDMSKEEFREQIIEMEAHMKALPVEDHIESPLFHYFAPGMYVREIHMPKGAVIIGKIHKHAHVNIISKGLVDVVTENGSATYEAPYTFVSEPETKRFVHILEDTIWSTVHAVDSEDLEKIEVDLIMPNYESLLNKDDDGGGS